MILLIGQNSRLEKFTLKNYLFDEIKIAKDSDKSKYL